MHAIIQGNASFSYTAEVRQLAVLPGVYSLKVTSHFSRARDPHPRVVFQTALDRQGLMALRDLIDSELGASLR